MDENNDKTIALAITAGKVTEAILRDAIRAYLHRNRVHKRSKTKTISKGKHTMKELKKENAELTSIEVTDKNIKSFERFARKYHVAYSLKKDRNSNPPKYYVFFRAKQVDQMTAAFKEFSAAALKVKNRPSLKETLKEKTIIAEALRKRSKVKNKRKEMER